MASSVFTDRLQVTMDAMAYRDMRGRLAPILDSLGAAPDYDRPGDSEGLWRLPCGGTFQAKRYGPRVGLGVSGRVLVALRAAAMLGEFLHSLGTEPHKVTILDATLDVAEDAPPVVQAAYTRATTGEGFQLSRKRVAATEVTKVFGLRLDGRESGTVYIGSKNAEARLKVYDKQHERFYHGVMDALPGVRYELSLKRPGLSLRDAYDPATVFWHHMSGVLPRPAGVGPWIAFGTGYSLPRREVMGALERFRMRLSSSTDLAGLIRIADDLPGGRATFLRELAAAFPVVQPVGLAAGATRH